MLPKTRSYRPRMSKSYIHITTIAKEHFLGIPDFVAETGRGKGADSSVGSVLGSRYAASRVRPSPEPPVEGIFPLELTWALIPFPKTRMRVSTEV